MIPTKVSAFNDPETGMRKLVYAGEPIAPSGRVDVECGAFGHFWYRYEDCMAKLFRWDVAVARFMGQARSRERELRIRNRVVRDAAAHTKDELLQWDWPPDMRTLIQVRYEQGLIGGMLPSHRVTGRSAQLHRLALGIERRLRTRRLRGRGLIGLRDAHEWVDPGDEPLAVDVRAIYEAQVRAGL